jgi:predicted secreted protein
MFLDKRSRKVILVAHCILNQNAKMDKTAYYPGAVSEIAKILVESGVGILQMPCPELHCLGLDRGAKKGSNMPFEKENTRVVGEMAKEENRIIYNAIAHSVLYQVEEYLRNGFEVLGILGINRSPTCGVETTWADDHEVPGSGVLIHTLKTGLSQKGISIPMLGIKPQEIEKAIATLKSIL